MNWTHGYYASAGYSYGYYAETMPARIRWASLVSGHVTPEKNFRYLDAGCGQGLNLVMAAAMHPDSEFVGIDFLPEHVHHARGLAKLCGLDNVTIIEGDFIDLARDPSSLGEFDIAVCHGITTWIGPAVKAGLFSLIGQVLKPGGVYYNSYNTQPGWLSAMPFQHLVLLEQRSKNGHDSLRAAKDSIEKVNEISDSLFKVQPNLPVRLKSLEGQDPAYLVQEYNNSHWRPVFVTEMMDDLAAVKLDYLGTATLADAFESTMKPELRQLLRDQPNPLLREQLRDYAIVQSFRRDIYVKGRRPAWVGELGAELRALAVQANPLIPRPAGDEPYKIKASGTELSGNAPYYNSLLDRVEAAPDGITVGELIDSEEDPRRKNSVFETLCMMMHGGWVSPRVAAETTRGPEIAAAMAEAVAQGAPYRYGPLPTTGSAQRLNDTEWTMIKLHLDGVAREDFGGQIMTTLTKLNRKLAKEGKAVEDEAEQKQMLDSMVTDFYDKKLPYLKATKLL